MSLADVLATVQSAVTTGINEIGVPNTRGQVVIGWPTSTELVSILAQPGHQYQVSVYPLPGARDVSRYLPEPLPITPPTVPVVATVAGNVATFSGTPTAGLNIWTFVTPLLAGALVQTVAGDTLASIATKTAAAVTALGYTGTTAVANGAAMTVTGGKMLKVNVGVAALAGGSAIAEIARKSCDIQVTTWSPDPATRAAVHDAIVTTVGTRDRLWLTLPDTSSMMIELVSDGWSGGSASRPDGDQSQSSYSLYQAHAVFRVEYAVNRSVATTEIGEGIAAIATTSGSGATTSTTQYTGG